MTSMPTGTRCTRCGRAMQCRMSWSEPCWTGVKDTQFLICVSPGIEGTACGSTATPAATIRSAQWRLQTSWSTMKMCLDS